MLTKITQLAVLLLISVTAFSQRQVTGTITDDSGTPLPGTNVVVKNTTTGTATDAQGKFSLEVPNDATTLVVSSIGFGTQEVQIPASNIVSVRLKADVSQLEEVVVSVGRGTQRTITDTPLPVDNFTNRDILSTGQVSFDKALQYRVPSFNVVNTPVNDATSLLDPYEIRNMGPSRTLILINGKRKNTSALVYTQTSPGRGETGADISAIPPDAIERIEILRDGASAQYGSDAIAGVMNIILKDNATDGSVTARLGITGEGDGEMFGVSLNNGSRLLDKGFINYTVDFSKVNLANRPGTVDAEGEANDFGADISEVQAFLAKKPDAGNINGSPETTAAKFLVNGGFDLSENANLYFNAAYVYKKVNSFANYRTPYWRRLEDFPYLQDLFNENGTYMGYVPTFEGDLNDYNATLGFRSSRNDWNTDVSLTTGGNRQVYTVRNSHNRNTTGVRNPDTYLGDLDEDGVVDANEIVPGTLKYRENSPITFRPGGYSFNHIVGNIDISRSLSEGIGLAFGTEFRSESFQIIEGDLASYEGGGADSFAGNSAENSFKSNRYNFGGYLGLSFDLTENFLIDATGRLENYSDFGNAFVWKVSSRYKFLDDKVTLRGAVSTGFRAPSLHQIFVQKAQYSFYPGVGIQVEGLINNVSPQARLLGIQQLDAEKSLNISAGVGIRPNSNLSFTIDYYNIKVEDRIVLGNNIGGTEFDENGNNIGTTELDNILRENGIVAANFFVNGLDSRTSGIDVVASYRNLPLGSGTLLFNLAGNYTLENKRIGDVKTPPIIGATGQSIVNVEQEALMFTSRPKFKAILGVDFTVNKFTFMLNNTLFGPTEFRNAGLDENLKVEFETKVVTDLGISYRASENVGITFNVNNIFNVLPEWKMVALNAEGQSVLNDAAERKRNSNAITFNQRYSQMTYDGYHFSQLGTILNLAVNVKF
jgi:iron complex outermembrane recepter protein